MKISSVPASLAMLVLVSTAQIANAAECTADSIETIEQLSADIDASCPSLDGDDGLDITTVSSLSAPQLQSLSACKDTSCTAFLTELVTATPDCEFMGINVKQTYFAVLKMCNAFAAGPVTKGELADIFEQVTSNVSTGSEDSSASGSSDGGTAIQVPEMTKKASMPKNASVPSNRSVVPTPTPTSTAAGASVVSVVTATVASAAAVTLFLV